MAQSSRPDDGRPDPDARSRAELDSPMISCPYGTSGDIVGASASWPRTRILALTGEVQLHRLLRSLLEPNGCKVVATAVPHEGPAANDPFDIVIVDLETLHLDVVSRAMRAYPDAQIIAICTAYREADCIAVLDMGADYLPRPFRALDLSARVRVAELRRFKAKGYRRYYRRGSLVMDLFDRKVVLGGESWRSPSELGVLTLLARKAGSVVTFGRILGDWGAQTWQPLAKPCAHASFVCGTEFERDPRRPDLLLTESRVGYRLARRIGRSAVF